MGDHDVRAVGQGAASALPISAPTSATWTANSWFTMNTICRIAADPVANGSAYDTNNGSAVPVILRLNGNAGGTLAEGDAYIIPAGATGAWAGKTNQIAAYVDGAWLYIVPKRGLRVEVQSVGGFMWFNGSAWAAEPGSTPLGTMATQNANAVAITGGTINGTASGASTRANGTFSDLRSATATIEGAMLVGTNVGGGDASIEFGDGRTADGNAYLDFHSSVGSDFDLRVIKFAGVNGEARFENWGTGGLILKNNDNAPFTFDVQGTTKFFVTGLASAVSVPFRLAQFTLGTLPSAAAYPGYCIDVTDATGGPKACRSDGTNWKILNTTTTVS